jgi:hypothetical protein
MRPAFGDRPVEVHSSGFSVRLSTDPATLPDLAAAWPALPADLVMQGERPARIIPDLEPTRGPRTP